MTNNDNVIIRLNVPKAAHRVLQRMAKFEGAPSVSELVRRVLQSYADRNMEEVDFSVGQWGGGKDRPREKPRLKSDEPYFGNLPVEAWVDDQALRVKFADDREIAFPLRWLPWLEEATPAQQNNIEIGRILLFWPDLGEGISVDSVLKGPNDRIKRAEQERLADAVTANR